MGRVDLNVPTGKGFLVEGDMMILVDPEDTTNIEYVEVAARERARYSHLWSEYIASGVDSGPEEISKIEPSEDMRSLYQGIFAARERVYLYMSMPSNVRVGGVPLFAKATSTNRRVGYVDNLLSQYKDPDFGTEFFLRGKTTLNLLNLDAFNPLGIKVRPRVEFEINKMIVKTIKDENIIQKIKTKCLYARPVTMGALPSTRGEVMPR